VGIARTAEIPAVTAADAGGTLNMAYVKITGHVARSLSYDPVGGYLVFWVEDGTGEVRVSAYRRRDREPAGAGKIRRWATKSPLPGRAHPRGLRRTHPQRARTPRADSPGAVQPESGELTVLDEGLRVRLAGEVRRVLVPYPGMTPSPCATTPARS
jgi:hypothetical protein